MVAVEQNNQEMTAKWSSSMTLVAALATIASATTANSEEGPLEQGKPSGAVSLTKGSCVCERERNIE